MNAIAQFRLDHGWDNPVPCSHCDHLIYWNATVDCWIHKGTSQRDCTFRATPKDGPE